MTTEFKVGIGKIKVVDGHNSLIAKSLGSCIGVAVYDEKNDVAGLAHVMLPEGDKDKPEKPAMYAPEAVELLKEEIIEKGGRKRNLKAKISGGAQMFSYTSDKNIGSRNAKKIKEELKNNDIKLTGEDVGGDHARTVTFKTGSMTMMVSIKI